jgi:tetratricopeptide (TPR) repeat protein
MPDLYSILGLSHRASSEEIKAAYWTLAKRSHPDVNSGNEQAERRTKEINRAYETLGDPEARAAYDLNLERKRAKGRRRVRGATATMAATFVLTVGSGLYFGLWSWDAEHQLAAYHEQIEPTKNGDFTVSDPVELREIHEAQAHVRPASAPLQQAGAKQQVAIEEPAPTASLPNELSTISSLGRGAKVSVEQPAREVPSSTEVAGTALPEPAAEPQTGVSTTVPARPAREETLRNELAGSLSPEASGDPHAPVEQPPPRNDASPRREPAKIKVLSASAMKSVLTDLAEAFRLESGHPVEFTFATAGQVEKRVVAGEATDIVIGTDVGTEEMVGQGLLVHDTRTIIARVGVGIGARRGATQPDISSTETLKQALLAAKSVIYPDPARGGASGIHFAQVIESLGISGALKQKAVLAANPDIVCESVAEGEVELCVHQISEILLVKGVTLVGPLPRDVQRVTTFAAALSARSNAAEAAIEFLSFLARPSFKARFARAGLDYQAIHQATHDAKFYSEQGLASYAKGDFDQAIADFDQAILLDPNNARAYNNRGNSWDDKGDHERALADYDEAIGIDPNNAAEFFYNRAITWWRKGALDRAIPDFDQAVRSSFANANFYSDRGLVWFDKGQYDRAIADFDRAIKLEPNFADSYYNRGRAWIGKGDFDRAIADYTQAIDHRPNDARAYSDRGWTYHLMGRERDAVIDINQAIALDQNDVTALIRRAQVYEKLGERDKSIADFKAAADLDLKVVKPINVMKHLVSPSWERR